MTTKRSAFLAGVDWYNLYGAEAKRDMNAPPGNKIAFFDGVLAARDGKNYDREIKRLEGNENG